MTTEAETAEMQPQAKDSWSHQKLEEARQDSPLEPLEEVQPLDTLILDFWPPELWKNKFLLFEANKPMVNCYGSPRKLT